jgi:hypothetical protein
MKQLHGGCSNSLIVRTRRMDTVLAGTALATLITRRVGLVACRLMGVVRHMDLLVRVAHLDMSDAVLGGMLKLCRKAMVENNNRGLKAVMATPWDLALVATLGTVTQLQASITTATKRAGTLNSTLVMGGEDMGRGMAVEGTVEEATYPDVRSICDCQSQRVKQVRTVKISRKRRYLCNEERAIHGCSNT